MPGLSVTRNYLPLDYFPVKLRCCCWGTAPDRWIEISWRRAEDLARRGNRVVVAMMLRGQEQAEEQADKSPLEEAWHVRSGRRSRPGAPSSAVFLRARRMGGTRAHRVSDSSPSSAHSTRVACCCWRRAATSATNPPSAAIASIECPPRSARQRTVAFDEAHFGIAESGSVMRLVRRFRLVGLALGLVIVGALALWKNTAAFPPPAAARGPQHTPAEPRLKAWWLCCDATSGRRIWSGPAGRSG